ncbi:pleckstrin homology domain-containing 1-like [Micractinium conductrix]|uniref:Pleckstrin homology domain-containing 1-like n=1 Tax=Micractinium conductrix TaxID=554055 RepID=A0A2P6V948_9CHLO|nr:pleckstrin homology domain-containing 1-like [Micractinium conductrix]|eukprot:PSC70595.1 pleckstrin homology domain-containing 1-like [Micractinium conductrix]
MPGERFHVRLLPEEGGGSGERVVAEVGLEGFNIMDSGGSRVMKKYPLHHISRWSMRGTSLILFTRSPVDVEDRSVTLQGDENTIRTVLDTLTCSCMQMAEMLQSGQGPDGAGQAAANSLNALLKKSKKPALLTADQVEFWHHPEKAGWMHSQGEHIKTWRKRWFVLKQGFLFRFATNDVTSSSKPRGIVDLSTVTDVADGGATTGRPNSIKLSTAAGHISYLCENETSQVEWFSALEGAVAKIVKLVAGVEDEEPVAAAGGKAKSWAEQLERTYATVGSTSGARRSGTSASAGDGGYSGGGGGGGGGGGSSRHQMVSVVGYDAAPGGGGGGGAGRTSSAPARAGGSSDYGYVTVDYGSIAGASAVPDSAPSGGYGGAPTGGYGGAATGGYGGGYAQQQQQQQQQPAAGYGGGGYGQQQAAPAAAPDYGQQAGGYGSGNLMDAVTAPQAAQQAQSSSPWQVHYTADGKPYFYNPQTGVTQWNAPA